MKDPIGFPPFFLDLPEVAFEAEELSFSGVLFLAIRRLETGFMSSSGLNYPLTFKGYAHLYEGCGEECTILGSGTVQEGLANPLHESRSLINVAGINLYEIGPRIHSGEGIACIHDASYCDDGHGWSRFLA